MRLLVVFFALAVLMAGSVVALQAGLEDGGEEYEIVNETWTPDAGNVTVLDESNRPGAFYDPTVMVYDETGAEVDKGDDYLWYDENGTVQAVTGGQLDGDTSANITYSFSQTTEQQRRFVALLGQVPRAVGLALPIGVVIAFLAFARGGG